MYTAEEKDTIQSHFETNFANGACDIQFFRSNSPMWKTFNCSHIHLFRTGPISQIRGFFVDIGASRSIIGQKQLTHVLKRLVRSDISRIRSNNSFRFGGVTVPSLGIIKLNLKVQVAMRPIPVLMGLVPVDVPALLGLLVLVSEQLYACNVANRLIHRKILSKPGQPLMYEDSWFVPLQRYESHLYAPMSFRKHTFYSTAQFLKLHKKFAHPSASNLYSLLKKAGTDAVSAKNSSNKKIL